MISLTMRDILWCRCHYGVMKEDTVDDTEMQPPSVSIEDSFPVLPAVSGHVVTPEMVAEVLEEE